MTVLSVKKRYYPCGIKTSGIITRPFLMSGRLRCSGRWKWPILAGAHLHKKFLVVKHFLLWQMKRNGGSSDIDYFSNLMPKLNSPLDVFQQMYLSNDILGRHLVFR